jgi:hypothetical protein
MVVTTIAMAKSTRTVAEVAAALGRLALAATGKRGVVP